MRQRYGADAVLIGFSTFEGRVTAASDWGGPNGTKARSAGSGPEAARHSFTQSATRSSSSSPHDDDAFEALSEPRLQRAIGVIYRPETELQSHYFEARLAQQFDAVLHIDRTRALEPLERTPLWDEGEPAETYPSGF